MFYPFVKKEMCIFVNPPRTAGTFVSYLKHFPMENSSNFIIYDIKTQPSEKDKQLNIDWQGMLESGRSLEDSLDYYIGKNIGQAQSSINLTKNKGTEPLEGSTVVSHQDGIAVIRVHNPKWNEIYLKPEENEILPQSREEETFPYAYAVIDHRDKGRCLLAIQCAPAFGSSTKTLKNSFNEFLYRNLGCLAPENVIVTEKYFPQKSLEFIKEHMNNHDALKSLTFRYANTDAGKYPVEAQDFIMIHSELLDKFGATFGDINLEFGEGYQKEKLDQLGFVIAYSKERGYDIGVKFQDSGAFTLGGNGVVAKIPMHKDVLTNIIEGNPSTHPTKDDDMKMWLDHVLDVLNG